VSLAISVSIIGDAVSVLDSSSWTASVAGEWRVEAVQQLLFSDDGGSSQSLRHLQ
jgi:hypothetical protein